MNETVSIDTPEGIEMFRYLAVKGALQLEVLGMRGRFPVFQQAKDIVAAHGVKPAGTKAAVLEQLEELLAQGSAECCAWCEAEELLAQGGAE